MTDLEALQAVIDARLSALRLLPHFPAQVVTQHADLTVDVTPDSPYLPGLSSLPLRVPLPAATVKVKAGTRVMVVFENGDPQLPAAVPLFDAAAGGLVEFDWGDAGTTTKVLGALELGSGTLEPAALGQTLQTYLNSLKTWADNLVLQTSMGPTLTPTGSGMPSPAVPTITSSKVKVAQ